MQAAALILVMALAPADASAPVDGPPAPSAVAAVDICELQGAWDVVACTVGGRDQLPLFWGHRWVFTGSAVRSLDATGRQAIPSDAFWADPTCSPARLDLPASGDIRLRRGIYRRVGDQLLWAWTCSDDGPPTSFDPAPGVVVWTLRRVKK